MIGPLLLAFTGGVLAALLVGWLVLRVIIRKLINLPSPTINNVTCLPGGQIQIDATIDAAPPGATLEGLYTEVYDDPNQVVSACPDSGGLSQPLPTTSPFSLVQKLPPGLSGLDDDLAVVWAVYRVCVVSSLAFHHCPESSSGPGLGVSRPIPAVAVEQLEAVPRAYRVSAGSPAAGAGRGPAANLVGALARAPETVLRYVPEASTPLDPRWRARGGPDPALEWTLLLLHRPDGFGAVLGVVCRADGREVRLTWVTSEWRFHTANRLTCESDEAGGLSLVVRPA
jgi:hypothetical protein